MTDKNPWKEAVLDELAMACMDAPQDEEPSSIIKRVLDWHVQVATDPAVNGGKVLVPQITDWGAVDKELIAILMKHGNERVWYERLNAGDDILSELRALLRKVSGQ